MLQKTHGGFHKVILQYGRDVEHFSFELHSWFKIAPCKREDFMQVAVEFQNEIIFTYFKKSETLFYGNVESRWSTLIPALKKVEERWDQSKQYFMEFLNSKKDFEKTTRQNPRYQRIAAIFRKEKFTRVQLAFTIDVSVPFVNFLTVLQSKGPLVHIIYKTMEDLLKIVMKRFLNVKVIDGFRGKELQKVDVTKKENQLEIGVKTERLLKNLIPFEQK